MTKVLFFVRSFSKGGPQPLRFQNIINHLYQDFDVHVLEMSHTAKSTSSSNKFYLHNMTYSKIGRILNPGTKRINRSVNHINRSTPLKHRLKLQVRKLLFPDTLIVEIPKIKVEILELHKKYQYDVIVASGFPFSSLILAKFVEKKLGDLPFIYDIGDPFYKNATLGIVKNYFAKKYEKYYLRWVDKLIVTNASTKDHYIKSYSKSIQEKQIEIIEQGVSNDVFYKIANIVTRKGSSGKKGVALIYAGQFYKKLREPFELFKAIELLNNDEEECNYRLDIYGKHSNYFKEKADTLSDIQFRGFKVNEEIISSYFSYDIIVFIDNAYGLQTPGKIFEIISLSKPVLFISDNEKSPSLYIANERDNVFITKNNAIDIAKTCREIDIFKKYDIGNFISNVTWDKRSKKYSDIISTISKNDKE